MSKDNTEEMLEAAEEANRNLTKDINQSRIEIREVSIQNDNLKKRIRQLEKSELILDKIKNLLKQ